MTAQTTRLTGRLTGLFRRMKPTRPVQVTADAYAPAEGHGHGAATSLEKLSEQEHRAPLARRTGIISRLSGGGAGARQEAEIAGLQHGFTEVADVVHAVRDRLDEHADRSDRLMEIMARLPEAIDALPETNRNQARMLEALQTHLDRQDRQATTLNKALDDLAQSTEHQGQVMSVIQGQIETNHKTDQEMLRGFSAMGQTLERLNESSQSSARALEEVTEQTRTADQSIEKLIKSNARNMTLLSAASWTLAIAAMGAAIYAGWAITSLGG